MMFSQWFGKWDSSIEHSAREGGGRTEDGGGRREIGEGTLHQSKGEYKLIVSLMVTIRTLSSGDGRVGHD